MDNFAERISKIKPSATLAVTVKAKKLKSEGKDVVNFAAGEPDFDTPDFIKQKAIEAIKSGFTKYTPSSGIPDLKRLISEKFKTDNGLDYPDSQIVVSCGAKHSIFNTLLALIDRGDEVIIPSPYWVSYPEMVNLCEGKACFLQTKAGNDFKLTAQDLKNSLTPKTKLLILNSPSNPCGSVYSAEELRRIAEICVLKNIFVISDEIYENFIYDGLKHVSIAALNKDTYNLTVTVNGVSKAYSMTGWRIGYLGGPVDIVKAISSIQDHSTSNPCSISQQAAVAALSAQNDFTKQMCAEFEKRKDYILARMDKIKNISYVRPRGAFYIFCDISKCGMGSLEFATRLLDEALVALIPGIGFGNDKYVRISFATSLPQIEKGMDRIEERIGKWTRQ
jgi:aspartate aminotransferase